MEFNEEWIDLIDEHILGKLNAKSQKEFDDLYTQEPAFREQVKRQSTLAEALRMQEVVDRREHIRSIQDELKQDLSHQRELKNLRQNTRPIFSLRNVAAAAALMVISFALGYWIDKPGPKPQGAGIVAETTDTLERLAGAQRPVLPRLIPWQILQLNEDGTSALVATRDIKLTVRKSTTNMQRYQRTSVEITLDTDETEVVEQAAAAETLSLLELRAASSQEGTFYLLINDQYYYLSPEGDVGNYVLQDPPVQKK